MSKHHTWFGGLLVAGCCVALLLGASGIAALNALQVSDNVQYRTLSTTANNMLEQYNSQAYDSIPLGTPAFGYEVLDFSNQISEEVKSAKVFVSAVPDMPTAKKIDVQITYEALGDTRYIQLSTIRTESE